MKILAEIFNEHNESLGIFSLMDYNGAYWWGLEPREKTAPFKFVRRDECIHINIVDKQALKCVMFPLREDDLDENICKY